VRPHPHVKMQTKKTKNVRKTSFYHCFLYFFFLKLKAEVGAGETSAASERVANTFLRQPSCPSGPGRCETSRTRGTSRRPNFLVLRAVLCSESGVSRGQFFFKLESSRNKPTSTHTHTHALSEGHARHSCLVLAERELTARSRAGIEPAAWGRSLTVQ
jgi:hypothetical protein